MRLDFFLVLSNLAISGFHSRSLIRTGQILVNGFIEKCAMLSLKVLDNISLLLSSQFNLKFKSMLRFFPVKDSSINIDSVQLLDSNGNSKHSFNTGERVKIKIKISGSACDNCYIWVGVFRVDGIYCHGTSRNLSKNKNEFMLIYPGFPLLTGKYYLSACIWKRNQKEPLLYKHKSCVFNVSFLRGDHGTVWPRGTERSVEIRDLEHVRGKPAQGHESGQPSAHCQGAYWRLIESQRNGVVENQTVLPTPHLHASLANLVRHTSDCSCGMMR